MDALLILAVLVPLLVIVKVLLVWLRPGWAKSVLAKIYGTPQVTIPVALLIAAVTLYFIVKAGVTPVELFAVIIFVSSLLVINFVTIGKETIEVFNKVLDEGKVLQRGALPIILWGALIVWLIYYLFTH